MTTGGRECSNKSVFLELARWRQKHGVAPSSYSGGIRYSSFVGHARLNSIGPHNGWRRLRRCLHSRLGKSQHLPAHQPLYHTVRNRRQGAISEAGSSPWAADQFWDRQGRQEGPQGQEPPLTTPRLRALLTTACVARRYGRKRNLQIRKFTVLERPWRPRHIPGEILQGRGVAHGSAEALGKTSVVCVGDSITSGVGASRAAATYPGHLQRLLGDDYVVTNLGACGAAMQRYSDLPYRRRVQWQAAQMARADIIVIMLGTNDARLRLGTSGELGGQKLPVLSRKRRRTSLPLVVGRTSVVRCIGSRMF